MLRYSARRKQAAETGGAACPGAGAAKAALSFAGRPSAPAFHSDL